MSKRCPDCGQRTSGIGRCPVCRVERNHAGVDHDHEIDPICVGCDEHAPEGSYSDERRGMWFCPSCSGLELTPTEREQLAAESTPVGTDLDRAVRWAVGDADAYPASDPGECAFVDGSDPRLIADGGRETWIVEQQGLDGEPAQGQTTIDGGVVKDGDDR